MPERVEVSAGEIPATLEGARVVAVEGPRIPGTSDFYDCGERSGEGYIVLRFDNGATLYADAPTLYRDARESSTGSEVHA